MSKGLFLIVATIISITTFIYSEKNSNANTPIVEQAFSVKVIAASMKDTIEQLKTIGTVQPFATIHVKSLVDGQLQSVGFKEGELVQENQVLFTIDPQPFQVQLQQAQAALEKDETQLANALRILNRAQALKNDKLVAEQDFEQLATNVDVIKAAIEADKAAIASAKLQLSYSSISSPVTGYTGNLLFNVGNIIAAKDNNPLVVINQVMPIYVSFSVPEKNLADIKQNLNSGLDKINIYTDNDNEHVLATGKITFINNTVDTTTGMIQLKATFPNIDKKLWPGQFVNISFPLRKISKAVLIPNNAIQTGPNGFYVFVVDNQKKVDIRTVIPGQVVSNETVIIKGLDSGEIVVTEGQLNLVKGTKVEYDLPANNRHMKIKDEADPIALQVSK